MTALERWGGTKIPGRPERCDQEDNAILTYLRSFHESVENEMRMRPICTGSLWLSTFEYNTNLPDVYDPAKNSWSSRKPMPTARSGSAVAALDGKIFVLGGERPGGTFKQAEAYDPDADVWAELAPMPMSVHGTGVVTIGDLSPPVEVSMAAQRMGTSRSH